MIPLFINFTIMNRADRFSILGCHAHQGSHPHPEECAGAAEEDGGCHTSDISCANRSRERGHQGIEWRDIPFCILGRCTTSPQQPESGTDLEDRHQLQPHLEEKSHTQN